MTNHVATHLRQLDADEVRRIVQKLRDGLPRHAVARAHGIGPERLAQIAAEHGMPAIVRPKRAVSAAGAVRRSRSLRVCGACGKGIGVGARYVRRRRDVLCLGCGGGK